MRIISAVIPVYNTNPTELRVCLNSVRAAQIADEIILVDDASNSAGTIAALQACSEMGCRVIPNRYTGTSAARATGVHAAKGCYVLNMDSDDTLKLDRDWRPDELAPINLARQNSPWTPTLDLWDFLDCPGAVQWGSIVQADLAKYVAADTSIHLEDLGWGYRLAISAWRDRIPWRYPSGLSYWWRSAEGRNSVTTRYSRNPKRYRQDLRDLFEHAVVHCGLNQHDAAAVRLWADRKALEQPHVESHTKAGARVDVHVLSYSGPAWRLREAIASLADEPVSVHVLVGGHHGSIGAARAHGFQLGSSEYVSFVDDDDICQPGTVQQLIDALDARPDAVGAYTDTEHLHPDGHRDTERKGRPWRPLRQLLYCPEITHLKVMRRAAVEPYLEIMARFPTYEEYVLAGLMTERGPWLHLPIIGATKRVLPATQSSMRLANNKLWREAVRTVTRPLMRAHRTQKETTDWASTVSDSRCDTSTI